MQTLLLIFGVSFVATISFAAEPRELRVMVEEVNDKRTTGKFFGECEVKLKFMGDALFHATGVTAVNVSKAEDDLGRDLRKEERDSSSFEQRETNQDAVSTKLSLRNPSRNAKLIRVVEGEVTLLRPTEANGGIARIPDALKQDGQWFDSAALSNASVKLMYVTKETFEKKKREHEAAKKTGDKLGDAFSEMFSGFFGGFGPGAKHEVRLLLQDPQQRIARISLLDASGQELKSASSMRSGGAHTYSFNGPPPADTQIKVLLKTPAAEQKLPFKIENIALP